MVITKTSKDIKVTIHIPDSISNAHIKINQIYEILKPKKSA